jgi:hypothetical protein
LLADDASVPEPVAPPRVLGVNWPEGNPPRAAPVAPSAPPFMPAGGAFASAVSLAALRLFHGQGRHEAMLFQPFWQPARSATSATALSLRLMARIVDPSRCARQGSRPAVDVRVRRPKSSSLRTVLDECCALAGRPEPTGAQSLSAAATGRGQPIRHRTAHCRSGLDTDPVAAGVYAPRSTGSTPLSRGAQAGDHVSFCGGWLGLK